MPGHSSILALSKPEVLTECPNAAGYSLTRETLDPTLNTTWDYVRLMYTDALKLFPDPYLFLGGDEVNPGCWADNARVATWLKANNISLANMQGYFEHRLAAIARNEMGKEVIVWQVCELFLLLIHIYLVTCLVIVYLPASCSSR